MSLYLLSDDYYFSVGLKEGFKNRGVEIKTMSIDSFVDENAIFEGDHIIIDLSDCMLRIKAWKLASEKNFRVVLCSDYIEMMSVIVRDMMMLSKNNNLKSFYNGYLTTFKRKTKRLTSREGEMLDLFIKGWGIEKIAKYMNVSKRTVQCFKTNSFNKLGVNKINVLERIN